MAHHLVNLSSRLQEVVLHVMNGVMSLLRAPGGDSHKLKPFKNSFGRVTREKKVSCGRFLRNRIHERVPQFLTTNR